MEALKIRLEGLEEKINKLLERFEILKSENEQLNSQLAQFQIVNEEQKKQIKDLEDRKKMVKLAGMISDSDGKQAELRKLIDLHVKEIDKCISLLSE
jgi:regulator of replication initiation timing